MLKDVSQNFGSAHETKTSQMNSSMGGVLIKACLDNIRRDVQDIYEKCNIKVMHMVIKNQ